MQPPTVHLGGDFQVRTRKAPFFVFFAILLKKIYGKIDNKCVLGALLVHAWIRFDKNSGFFSG